jgi:diacylglycerol O-acyltransferase-1
LAAEAVVSYHSNDFLAVLTTLLHMAIPSTFVWLVLFYLYFHLWLNLWAELLRFGDRAFYKVPSIVPVSL